MSATARGLAAISAALILGAHAPSRAAVEHTAIVSAPKVVSGPSPLSSTCSGVPGHYYGTEVEPQVAVDPADPSRVIATWIQDRYASHGGGQSNGIAFSTDGGRTWTNRSVPGISRCTGGAWERATDPWVTVSPNGTSYLVSLSMDGLLAEPTPFYDRNALTVSRSLDGGATWDDPVVVVEDPALNLNDKEAITADPTTPANAYVVWAKFMASLYPVTFVSRTTDNGVTWGPGIPTGSTGQGNEIVVLPDGTLLNLYASGDVRLIRSTDKGLTWSRSSNVATMLGSDSRTRDGDDIRAGESIPSFDAGADGSVVAAWAERDPDGGNSRSGSGDTVERIAFTRSTNGGLTFTEPVSVAPDAVRPFTPAVAVAADGTIGVTYYDLRNDKVKGGAATTDVWFSWSRDGGVTWHEEHIAGPFNVLRAPFAAGYFLGDYQGLAAGTDTFQAIFSMAPNKGRAPVTDVYHVRIRMAETEVRGRTTRPLPATGVPGWGWALFALLGAAAGARFVLARAS